MIDHDGIDRELLRFELDGPGFEPASSRKPGHGLDLLERRLASLFGSSASLEMTASDGHTQIAISLLSEVGQAIVVCGLPSSAPLT